MKQIEKRSRCAFRRHWSAQSAQGLRSLAAIVTRGLFLGLLAVSFTPYQVAAADNAAQLSNRSRSLSAHELAAARLTIAMQPVVVPHPRLADFGRVHRSRDAQRVADWVVDSGDNRGMPFLIVDKKDAKVFVFHAGGLLRGAAPALVGLARGDYSVPGIGDLKLSQIPPKERTTPAGRFVSFMGYNSHGKEVLWVDYHGGVSLHRVMSVSASEHRLQRLASPRPLDHRISYGCINVPAKFYHDVVRPAFTGRNGISYVLPDTRSIREIFPTYYDVPLTPGNRHNSGSRQESKSRPR